MIFPALSGLSTQKTAPKIGSDQVSYRNRLKGKAVWPSKPPVSACS